jgi:hypothetical protein
MDALESQELPVMAAALADLEYRDPFLLTVLAGKQARVLWGRNSSSSTSSTSM